MNAYLIRVAASKSPIEILSNADSVRHEIEQAESDVHRILELDDMWAGLHYTLTAEVPIPKYAALRRGVLWDDDSFENVLMGGEPTVFHSTFGPARYLDPDEVTRMATKLTSLDVESFMERYDPESLIDEHIPPPIWNDEASIRSRLREYFIKLVNFYRTAAESGDSMLIYIV